MIGPVEPLLVKLTDAMRTLCIGRTTLYELMDGGELETVKIGRRRLIVTSSMNDYIDRLIAGQQKPSRSETDDEGDLVRRRVVA